MGFSLLPENVVRWAARQGIPSRTNPDTRQVALLFRVLDRDAPLFVGAASGGRYLFATLRLPLHVAAGRGAAAAEAVAGLNAAASAPGTWIYEAERASVQLRTVLPVVDAEYTERGLRIVVDAIVDSAREGGAKLAAALR